MKNLFSFAVVAVYIASTASMAIADQKGQHPSPAPAHNSAPSSPPPRSEPPQRAPEPPRQSAPAPTQRAPEPPQRAPEPSRPAAPAPAPVQKAPEPSRPAAPVQQPSHKPPVTPPGQKPPVTPPGQKPPVTPPGQKPPVTPPGQKPPAKRPPGSVKPPPAVVKTKKDPKTGATKTFLTSGATVVKGKDGSQKTVLPGSSFTQSHTVTKQKDGTIVEKSPGQVVTRQKNVTKIEVHNNVIIERTSVKIVNNKRVEVVERNYRTRINGRDYDFDRHYDHRDHGGWFVRVYTPIWAPWYGIYYTPGGWVAWNNPYNYCWWAGCSFGYTPFVTYTWNVGYGYYFRPRYHYRRANELLADYLWAAYLQQRYDQQVAEAQAQAEELAAEQAANAQADADELAADQAARDQEAAQLAANQPVINQVEAPVPDPIVAQTDDQVTQAATDIQQGNVADVSQAILTHIFAVNTTISGDAQLPNSDETYQCEVSEGDLIKLNQDKPPAATDEDAIMSVVTSKKGDCAPGVSIKVSMSDLQNMLNDFTAKVEEGLNVMKTNNVAAGN